MQQRASRQAVSGSGRGTGSAPASPSEAGRRGRSGQASEARSGLGREPGQGSDPPELAPSLPGTQSLPVETFSQAGLSQVRRRSNLQSGQEAGCPVASEGERARDQAVKPSTSSSSSCFEALTCLPDSLLTLSLDSTLGCVQINL